MKCKPQPWQKWQKENSAILYLQNIQFQNKIAVTQLILTSIGYIGWNDFRWEKVVPSPWESGALHHQGRVVQGGDRFLHWVQGSRSIEVCWFLPGQTNHAGVHTEELGLIQASWDWNVQKLKLKKRLHCRMYFHFRNALNPYTHINQQRKDFIV